MISHSGGLTLCIFWAFRLSLCILARLITALCLLQYVFWFWCGLKLVWLETYIWSHFGLCLLMQTLAKHVMNIHMNALQMSEEARPGELQLNTLKKYIAYCRTCVHCSNLLAVFLAMYSARFCNLWNFDCLSMCSLCGVLVCYRPYSLWLTALVRIPPVK